MPSQRVLAGDLPEGSAAVCVGQWDPLLAEHLQFFSAFADRAKVTGRVPVAVLLHPKPAALRLGTSRFPTIDSPGVRARAIVATGITAVLQFSMTRDEIEHGAEWFLGALDDRLAVAELCIKASQSLGPAGRGDHRSINTACEARGIHLTTTSGREPTVGSYNNVVLALANANSWSTVSVLGRGLLRLYGEVPSFEFGDPSRDHFVCDFDISRFEEVAGSLRSTPLHAVPTDEKERILSIRGTV